MGGLPSRCGPTDRALSCAAGADHQRGGAEARRQTVPRIDWGERSGVSCSALLDGAPRARSALQPPESREKTAHLGGVFSISLPVHRSEAGLLDETHMKVDADQPDNRSEKGNEIGYQEEQTPAKREDPIVYRVSNDGEEASRDKDGGFGSIDPDPPRGAHLKLRDGDADNASHGKHRPSYVEGRLFQGAGDSGDACEYEQR